MIDKIVLFVSQDQGSGNALSLVVRKMSEDERIRLIVFAAKQSKAVFSQLGIAFKDMDKKILAEEIDFNPDLIVTGASMRDSIEKDAIIYAHQHNIRSISIIDFWKNFWERFTVSAKKDYSLLPDFILVMDDIAKDRMMFEGFPEDKLIVTGNPYFDTFVNSEVTREVAINNRILYIAQPLMQNSRLEVDLKTLSDLIEVIDKLELKNQLIIKPHPKEDDSVYRRYLNNWVMIDNKKDIKQLVKESSVIVGRDSSVLFESVFYGKLVVSYQPNIEKYDGLVSNRLGLSHLVRSKSELERILKKAVNRELKARISGIIKYYNDGLCTERAIGFIKNIL